MSDFLSQLNPTDGHILAGVQIDANRFLARVKMPQLESIAPDPRDTEDKRKLASIKELQDLRDIRDDVQRLFEGQKAKNVAPYASYIVDVYHGADGMTPPIILYSERALPVAVDERFGFGAISVPFGQKLVAKTVKPSWRRALRQQTRSPPQGAASSRSISVTVGLKLGPGKRFTTSMYWVSGPTRLFP